jgi:CHAD domain-containing protein
VLPILELELELKHGPVDALFSLAGKLGKAARLQPMTVSKAQRGYALFLDQSPAPVKATPLQLERQQTPLAAFQHIASACLTQLEANESGLLKSDNPEYLHQARVAVRRLRAALRLFAPVLPRPFVKHWGPAWRALGQVLGEARDWDVFCESTLSELTATLPRRDAARLQRWARAQASDARSEVRRHLLGKRHPARLLAFSRALQQLNAAEPSIAKAKPAGAGSQRGTGLKRWARRQLKAREQVLRQRIRKADPRDDDARHRVRIDAKKLRYSLEFFTSLWPADQVHAYAKALARVQELLGLMNDRVTARARLAAAASDGKTHARAAAPTPTQPTPPAPNAPAVALLRDRLAVLLGHDAQRLPSVLKALRGTPMPWRKQAAGGKGAKAPRRQKK